ncbi:hypothetical protein N9S78_00470 [bacterium]|nr:hypothetical protein [bacterium]
MIIKTPLRLSLVGGGSDLRYFYEKNNGMSLGFPIKNYNYIFFSKINNQLLQIVSDKENIETSNPDLIKDNIIRSIFTKYKIDKKKIFIFSDLPYGTGLGSSSAMTVGFINAINSIQNLKMKRQEIAETAYKIEEEYSGSTIGKQDHFMSTFGGINLFKYKKNSKTTIEKLNISKKKIQNLEDSILLIRVGGIRNAVEILHDQKSNLISNQSKQENMKKIIQFVPYVKEAIIKSDMKELGRLISLTWELKKSLSKFISNILVDQLYDFLISQGIYGGKLLGAGSSGYFLAICDPKTKQKLIQKFNDDALSINVDTDGTHIKI